MPKHIRQDIKGTSFSVFTLHWRYLSHLGAKGSFMSHDQSGSIESIPSVLDPELWLSAAGNGTVRPGKNTHPEPKRNYSQPLDEKDETWEDQQKSCPICLRGTRVSQRVCGGQRTTSQSRSLPSSVWGQGLNSGCQAWPQVPSPTLSGPLTQFLNDSLQMRTIGVCGGVDEALKW